MIPILDPTYSQIAEKVAVLRGRPDNDPNTMVMQDAIWTFGKETFPQRTFDLLVSESDNREVRIEQKKFKFDGETIVTTNSDYNCVSIPPIDNLEVGDIVIRLQKGNQQLVVMNTPDSVYGVQEWQMEDRSETQSQPLVEG